MLMRYNNGAICEFILFACLHMFMCVHVVSFKLNFVC